MQLPHFKSYTKSDLLSLTTIRRFETKMGERLQVSLGLETEDFRRLDVEYVVFGIPEDIGVLANGGVSGTSTGWISFLQAFLNMQSNDFCTGDDVALIGHFDFGDLQYLIDRNAMGEEEKKAAYSYAVGAIDEEVEKLVKRIVAAGKTPIAIGGGHNNAYPIIKGSAKGLVDSGRANLPRIHCINLDAHADYRATEGRHSGNAFRYAEEDGFLQKYCVLGLQEAYLPQNVWVDFVNNPFFDCITYEDIYIHEKRNFRQAVMHAIDFADGEHVGIELDLDAVEGVLSSAATPVGVPPVHARQYVALCAGAPNVVYLHICEGATRLSNGRADEGTGKLIATLVADFVKMNSGDL